jgi:hypothetical protein
MPLQENARDYPSIKKFWDELSTGWKLFDIEVIPTSARVFRGVNNKGIKTGNARGRERMTLIASSLSYETLNHANLQNMRCAVLGIQTEPRESAHHRTFQ